MTKIEMDTAESILRHRCSTAANISSHIRDPSEPSDHLETPFSTHPSSTTTATPITSTTSTTTTTNERAKLLDAATLAFCAWIYPMSAWCSGRAQTWCLHLFVQLCEWCDGLLLGLWVMLDAYKNENFTILETEDRNRGGFFCFCCFSCKKLLLLILFLSILSYGIVPKRPSEQEIQLDPTLNPLPLVRTMLDVACFPVQPDVSGQTFRTGIAFSEFVRSMRAHLLQQQIIGITSFHVGLPLCLLAYVDDERHTIRVFANPRLVGIPSEKEGETQVIRETDLICPQVASVERQRHTHIVIEYQEMNTKGQFLYFRKNASDVPLTMKEVMKGAPAFILQHLLDTLSQKSLCIQSKT